jgi:competence protein ComGF
MQAIQIKARSLIPGIAALLLILTGQAAAQGPYPFAFEHAGQARLDDDLQELSGFAKRRVERISGSDSLARTEPWTLYGRVGLVNFKNDLDASSGGPHFTWRSTGPGAGGKKFYLGIHRRF